MSFRNALIALALAGLSAAPALAGEYNLVLEQRTMNFTGRERPAMTVNGLIPGPLLRFREGEDVVIHVANRLPEPSSIHRHGFVIPSDMDGVPGAQEAENGAQRMDRMVHSYFAVDQFERRFNKGRDSLNWNAEGWIGGDYNKL